MVLRRKMLAGNDHYIKRNLWNYFVLKLKKPETIRTTNKTKSHKRKDIIKIRTMINGIKTQCWRIIKFVDF